jgi:hypothetical protein
MIFAASILRLECRSRTLLFGLGDYESTLKVKVVGTSEMAIPDYTD